MIKHFSLLLLIAFFFSSTGNAQISNGKLYLAKGQKFLVTNISKSVSTMEMMGQPMEMSADVNMDYELNVTDKKDSSILLTSTLTKIKMKSAIMGQDLSFDSEKKEDLEGEMGKGFKNQLNVLKEIELNNEAIIVNAKKEEITETQSSMMDMMKGLTGGNKEDDNGASAAFQIIPSGKKIGDTWSDSVSLDGVKINRTFVIKEIIGCNATISFTGKQLTEKKMEQQGMEVNVTMDAVLSGESIVDISTGIVKQKSTLMDGTGSADAMGQAIPMTFKVTSNITVKSL
jgi:hypothetical protein